MRDSWIILLPSKAKSSCVKEEALRACSGQLVNLHPRGSFLVSIWRGNADPVGSVQTVELLPHGPVLNPCLELVLKLELLLCLGLLVARNTQVVHNGANHLPIVFVIAQGHKLYEHALQLDASVFSFELPVDSDLFLVSRLTPGLKLGVQIVDVLQPPVVNALNVQRAELRPC